MPSETTPASPAPGASPPPLGRQPPVSAEIVTPQDARGNGPREQPPVTPREILAILLLIVAADVTIYRGLGFAGYALFFLVAPLLLWLGAPRPSFGRSFFLIGLMLVLLPLLESEDPIIREGIRAMLADRLAEAKALARIRQTKGWTAFQLADRVTLEILRANSTKLSRYTDPGKRREALRRFHDYAYQWY